jgi:hypothetical protein
MDIKFDILDYLGKVDGGIIILLSLSYDGEYYESTFYYKENLIALTPDERLEEKIGSPIEDWEGYNELVIEIIKKLVPYEEMINRINDLDLSKYGIVFGDSDVIKSQNSQK